MVVQALPKSIYIEMLGGFRVLADGAEPGARGWPGRRSAELVQLLALANRHRLSREQVIEALWAHLDPEAGAANLRKAAHQARQALGSQDAVVLRGGLVSLFPSCDVETDAERFERSGEAALLGGDPAACARVAATYTGDLLPDSAYEEWAQEQRGWLRSRWLELLRQSGDWARLVEAEPMDEAAHCELMRAALASGRRHEAIRWYGHLKTNLARGLGVLPGSESEALYRECVAGLGPAEAEFVGRQVELARATAALRAAARAEAGVVVVRGPAGVGKSAFCRRLCGVARAEGWLVVTIATTGWGTPYAPVELAVEELLGHDRSVLDALPQHTCAVLGRLSPVLTPTPALDGPLTRHQVIGAVRQLLLARADVAGTPVMLVVDDAHLADDATAEVLHHLGRAGSGAFLIVLAYRAELASATLHRSVAGLVRGGRAIEIDLGPLERDDAAALVAAGAPSRPDPAAVERIVELAEGNPFFLLELTRGLAGGVPAAIPATIWDAIGARFLELDDATLAMLARLAVAGDNLELASVLALTGLPEPEAWALLDAALETGVLVVAGAHYRFRHELVRQALVERLPQHRRIAVHRDAARRLAASGAAPALIARHWLDGGRPDDAAEWLLTAAREAVEVGAFADALTRLEPLLEHAPDHADALCLRAEVLEALGDRRAPEAYAVAARSVGEPASHEIRPRQAFAEIKSGDPNAALRTLKGVTPTSVRGLLSQALTLSAAAAIGPYGDVDFAVRKAEEAYRLAIGAGDSGAMLDASWAAALAAHSTGRLPDRLREYLLSTHDVPELAIRVFDGQLCVTERLLHGALPYDEVIAFADSLGAEARRLGAGRGSAFAMTLRGEAKLLSGDLNTADLDLAAGARLHAAIDAPTGEALALQRRAEVALYRGHHAEADALLEQALARARESNVGHHILDRVYGTKAAAAPDPDSALAAVEEAEAGIRGPTETCPTCSITFLVPAAIASARGRDLDRAEQYVQRAHTLVDFVSLPPAWRAAVEEAKGHFAHAAGSPEVARGHFRAAAERFRAHSQPLDERRCAGLAANPS
jgi:DNA-binding SARP family transcriptional activator/tetratricopeptide (TPR) repeat protein